MSYRIKSVATLTGITPSTLRAWERRYGLITPGRSDSGYRLYSEADIKLFQRMQSLVDGGLAPSEAAAVLRGDATGLAPAGLSDAGLSEIRRDLLDALLALDSEAAVQAARPLMSCSFEQRFDEVLLPVLREIGSRWARGEATVPQEHFASAFVRERVVSAMASIATPEAASEVVCAGAPGEQHELGLLIVAANLALRGWRVTYLGLEVPLDSLVPLLAERSPPLLCTSLVRPIEANACLAFATKFREVAPPPTMVVIGGAGIPPELLGSPSQGLHLVRTLDQLLEIIPSPPLRDWQGLR
jgi:DNA-binding transcriptional MerR regulator